MENTSTQTWVVIAVVIVAVVALIAGYAYRRRQSQRLRQRFGPEYSRTVAALGSEARAESELMAREKRVERFRIKPLDPAQAARFSAAWKALQTRFVDNPCGSVAQADRLVRDLMDTRGYPMGDFERRAGDISVDHPHVVANYRAAQAIAARSERGEADTEDLRNAVVHYRALFDELLEVREENARPMPAHRLRMQA